MSTIMEKKRKFDENVSIILASIPKKRFYYFDGKNCDNVFFDSQTGLLFTYCNGERDFPENSAGFYDWKIATLEDFWMAIDGFNQMHSYCYYYRVIYGGKIQFKSFDARNNMTDRLEDWRSDARTAFCSHALTANYSPEPRHIIELFIKNKLVPKFNNYSDKQQRFREVAAFWDETWRAWLVEGYDRKAIASSPIKYCSAVAKLTADALEFWRAYEAEQGLDKISQATFKLGAAYVADSNLTAEENALLEARHKFLSERVKIGGEEVAGKILEIQAEGEALTARREEILSGKNILVELAEYEAAPRVSFDFLAENIADTITRAQERAAFFSEHRDLVTAVVNGWDEWNSAYRNFKTNQREQFTTICRQNAIDVENYNGWYEDWQGVRFAIEQRFQPLIEFAFRKVENADAVIKALKVLQDYRDAVDNFYMNERKNIHQKFAFQAGGDLQEKFETESELYKLAEKFQRDLQEIIFESETEARVFLLKWAEPITHVAIDEIIAFVQDKNLDAISSEILGQFAELKRRNFEAYLADSKAYSEALQKREREFNALIFRMRKDLNRQG